MRAQLRHDPARGAGYGVIDVQAFEGRDTDIAFSLRRASDGRYLGSGDWREDEQRLKPDVVQYRDGALLLLIGPAVVDMVDALNTFALTLYPPGGEGRRAGLEIGDLIYSSLAGGQGVAQAATAPLSMSPMPEMRLDPEPEPEPVPPPESGAQSALPPETQLPELKDPVERGSRAPLVLLLLALVCAAGVYCWRHFAQPPESAPPAANAAVSEPSSPAENAPSSPAAAPGKNAPAPPSAEAPPLQRARELLRSGGTPEQAVELAKTMRTPEGADGAFLLLEDAAQKGAPEAMLGLAGFYDPADAAPKGSIRPDPALAFKWYVQARNGGQDAANGKLAALRAWAEAEKAGNPQAGKLLENWGE